MTHRTEKLTRAESDEIDNDMSQWRSTAELEAAINHYRDRFGPILGFDPRGKSWRESIAMHEFATVHGASRARWDPNEPADFRLEINGEDVPFQLVEVFQDGVYRSAALKHFLKTGESLQFTITGPYIDKELLPLFEKRVKAKALHGYPTDLVLAVRAQIGLEEKIMVYLYDRLLPIFGPYTPKFRAIVLRTDEVTDIFSCIGNGFPELPSIHHERAKKVGHFLY